MAMRALAMTMHPDKLFELTAGRAPWHDMGRLGQARLLIWRALTLGHPARLVVLDLPVHLGPSLSRNLCRAGTVPS